MTALNFLLTEDSVSVCTDTLALSGVDKLPYKLVDKAFLFPQMNCIVAGTGNMPAILHWVSFIREHTTANGIHVLNRISEHAMGEQMEQEIVSEDFTTTIYQFGLSEVDDLFHGYAYRSTNGFKSEELENGIGVKPPDAFITNGTLDMDKVNFRYDNFLEIEDSFVEIMRKQKEYDDELPLDNKVGIGGRIQMLTLSRDGAFSKNLHTFSDFESVLETISRRLNTCF